ncbi:MAG: hypothetical protein LAQ30_10995 [Acidobacteriia bacterium]|nr:hypothetical protein [Terriglobia bacterium]
MRRLLLCLSLAALPAFGGAPVSRPSPITLYADFQQDPPRPISNPWWATPGRTVGLI